MEFLEHQSVDEHERTRYLIQTAQQDISIPLARITTCGRLAIDILHSAHQHPDGHLEAIYGPPDAQLLARKGTSTAFILLALLASQPGCFATKDWLSEKLGHLRDVESEEDEEENEGLKRVDNVVSQLRSLLSPPRPNESRDEQLKRRRLVEYQRASGESGPGYRLAGMPLVWLDVVEIEAALKRARRLEQFGTDGLTEWQAAYDLATQGRFLPGEAYSDWTEWRRQEMETHLWDCVQVLWHRHLERGKAGEDEAIRILRAYWQAHRTSEDALRPLLELLGKRERFGEAEAYYQQLCAALSAEDKQPDQRTRDIMDFQQAVQLQRKRTVVNSEKEDEIAPPTLSLFGNQSEDFPQELHCGEREPSFSLPSFLQPDFDVFARLATVLNKPSIVQEREISYFDQQTRLYWRAREETALPATTLYASVLRHIDDITLLLARSHVPTLRSYLCEIACRTVLLAGILHYDLGHYTKARQQYHVAFQAATEANNPILQAIVWGWMSFTWTYTKCYTEAQHCIQYARHFAAQTSDILAQVWLGAIEAEIQAHLHNREACLQSLDGMEQKIGVAPSQDTSYLFEFNPVLLLGYKGVCLQQFYQRHIPATHSLLQEAQQSLELALASEVPLKRKLYYLNDLAGVYARRGEAEKACASLLQSIPLLKGIGNGSKTIQKHLLQARALLQPYKATAPVQALDEQMAPWLIEQ